MKICLTDVKNNDTSKKEKCVDLTDLSGTINGLKRRFDNAKNSRIRIFGAPRQNR